MAADVLDEDQWLYGDSEEQGLKLQTQDVAPETVKENGRDSTPTLEEMDILDIPDPAPIDKAALETPAESAFIDESNVEEDEADEDEGQKNGEDDSESDDDDDVQITIGEIKTDSVYNRQQSYPRLPVTPGGTPGTLARKVDLEAVPQINGQSIFEVDLEAADKPWRLPGADITDYFNYGFTEDTWKLYCDKQRKTKTEVGNLNIIAVQSSRAVTTTEPSVFSSIGGVPTIPKLPLLSHVPLVLPSAPALSTLASQMPTSVAEGGNTPEADGNDGGSDGRATPELPAQDSSTGTSNLPLKPPLIPPPILPPNSLASLTGNLPPPPFGFPPPGFPGGPQDQNLAAAMAAAMFGGLRPPDGSGSLPTLPLPPQLPQGPGGFPPLHPPGLPGLGPGGLPEGMPPPFPGLPFPHPGDHGPMPFDERGMPPMPPDILGHGGPFPWDPSMGPPPPEFFEGFRPRSRSRSQSTSSRSRSHSRSSSYDRYKRGSRRHRRKSRSRSRSRDRDRHRSSRHHRDHHRSDRHDRDKDRDRDRRSRRDRDDRSRHERSSRRHRSTSRDKDEERSSRKDKQKSSEQDNVRESRSGSRTPS